MDREYGRFQLVNDDEKETSLFYLENVSREDDFWLKLANEQETFSVSYWIHKVQENRSEHVCNS